MKGDTRFMLECTYSYLVGKLYDWERRNQELLKNVNYYGAIFIIGAIFAIIADIFYIVLVQGYPIGLLLTFPASVWITSLLIDVLPLIFVVILVNYAWRIHVPR